MYCNILIATDGSQLAEKAVSHGVSLAKSVSANVTALIVEAPCRALHFTSIVTFSILPVKRLAMPA